MPVPIRFVGGGHDTTIVFNHTFSGQVFTVPINFTVSTVTFDPNLWLISKNNTVTYDAVGLNLKVFIEAFYIGSRLQKAVLFDNGMSSDPTASDSITVELHDPVQTNSIIVVTKALMHTNGNAQAIFPLSILNHSYYIVIRHRNSIQTWSKNTILFNSSAVSFDFTSP
jgi:hypothetical protein